MAREPTGALSAVLDQPEASVQGDGIGVDDVIDQLDGSSFTSLMLVFSLISASPASAIPGVTTMVAGIVFILVAQMILGRVRLAAELHHPTPDGPGQAMQGHRVAAPACPLHRTISEIPADVPFSPTLALAAAFPDPGLTLVMPFLEFIPMSGSVASAVIAILAAGLLTRDGVLVLAALGLLTTVPVMVWAFGVGG